MSSRFWIPALLLCAARVFAGCSDATPEDSPGGVVSSGQRSFVQLRLAHDEPSPDLEAVRFGRDVLYLEPEPVISDPDIATIDVQRDGGQLTFDIRFRGEAPTRLARVTRTNTGKRIAFLLDSRIHAAPLIRSEMGDPFQIGAQMSEIDAEWMEQRVRARWQRP